MEDINLYTLLFLVLAGFIAAFIDSVVGGGGLISIPALLFTGISPSAALATNKLAGTMGSLTSTISFIRAGKVDLIRHQVVSNHRDWSGVRSIRCTFRFRRDIEAPYFDLAGHCRDLYVGKKGLG